MGSGLTRKASLGTEIWGNSYRNPALGQTLAPLCPGLGCQTTSWYKELGAREWRGAEVGAATSERREEGCDSRETSPQRHRGAAAARALWYAFPEERARARLGSALKVPLGNLGSALWAVGSHSSFQDRSSVAYGGGP